MTFDCYAAGCIHNDLGDCDYTDSSGYTTIEIGEDGVCLKYEENQQ